MNQLLSSRPELASSSDGTPIDPELLGVDHDADPGSMLWTVGYAGIRDLLLRRRGRAR